jgi:hypothetical protein
MCGCIDEGHDYSKADDKINYFNKICIEGHVYYMRETGHTGFLAIKLNDNGTPAHCDNE